MQIRTGPRSFPLNGHFAHLFHQVVIERERDIHAPTIRETRLRAIGLRRAREYGQQQRHMRDLYS